MANVDDQPVAPEQQPAPTGVGNDPGFSGGREDRGAQADNAADAEAAAQQESNRNDGPVAAAPDDHKRSDPLAEFGDKVPSAGEIVAGVGWLDTSAPAEGSSIGKSADERATAFDDAAARDKQLNDWWSDHGPTWDALKQEKASLDGEYEEISARALAGTASKQEMDSYVSRSSDWSQRAQDFWREGSPAVAGSIKSERDLSDARRGVVDLMTAQGQDDASAVAQHDAGNERFGQYDQQNAGALQDFDTVRSAPGGNAPYRPELDDVAQMANEQARATWQAQDAQTPWYAGGSAQGPMPPWADWVPTTPQGEQTYFEERYGHPFSPATNPLDKTSWELAQYDIQLGRNAAAAAAAHANDPSAWDVAQRILGGVSDFPTRLLTATTAAGMGIPIPGVNQLAAVIAAVRSGDGNYLKPGFGGQYPINRTRDFLAAIPYVLAGDTYAFTPETKAYFDYVTKAGPANTFVPISGDAPGGRQLGLYDVPVLGGFAHAAASIFSAGPVNIAPDKLYADIKAGMPTAEIEKKYPGALGPQLLWDLLLNPVNYVPLGKVDEAATALRAAVRGEGMGGLSEIASKIESNRARAISDGGFADIAVGQIGPKLEQNGVDWTRAIVDHGYVAEPRGIFDATKMVARGELPGYAYLSANERQFMRDLYQGASYEFSKNVGQETANRSFERYITERSGLPANVDPLRFSDGISKTAGNDAAALRAVGQQALEHWADTGRAIRGGTMDPWGAVARAQGQLEQWARIGSQQMLRASVGTFKTGLLALNPAYYLSNILTNYWQGLQYGVFVRPMFHPTIAGLFDRIPAYETRRASFAARYGFELLPGETMLQDIAGASSPTLGYRETFRSGRDAGVQIPGPEKPMSYASYRDERGAWMLTPGERAGAAIQQVTNLPRAILGTAMKPFGSDIEFAFRASAFEKHLSTNIDRTLEDGVLGRMERFGSVAPTEMDKQYIRETIDKIRTHEITNVQQANAHLVDLQLRHESANPGNSTVRGWTETPAYDVIKGASGYQQARNIMQASLRDSDVAIAKAGPGERARLVEEKNQRLAQAAAMDKQGVTPPPASFMVGDKTVMDRLGYLNREIDFHAGQVNEAVVRGENAAANLLELHSLQHEYLETMQRGLNLGPQRVLTGDPGLLAAMRALEEMHLDAYTEATRLLPDAVRLSEIRRVAYDAQFGHLPIEKRNAFLNPAQFAERRAAGPMPANWTFENRRYPSGKAYDKAWAMFFAERAKMEQAIAAHWDLMQHGIPDSYHWEPGAAPRGPGPIAASGPSPMRPEESRQFGAAQPGETPTMPRQPDAVTAEGLTPLPGEGGQARTFSDAFAPLATIDWRVQAEMNRLGVAGGFNPIHGAPVAPLSDRSLTAAQWRQVQAGKGEAVWTRELDRLRQAGANAKDGAMRQGFTQLADEMEQMGWQGWIERQESRIAQSRAIGEKIAAGRNQDWPTTDEIALAFNDPNAQWVREGAGEKLRPNDTVARREILAERRAELDKALEGKTGDERARLIQEINYQNAAHGYDIPMGREYQTMRELRDELAQMGRPLDNLFEQQVRERVGATVDRVRGGMPEDRQRLMDFAADLDRRGKEHQAKRESWAAQRDGKIREMAGVPPEPVAAPVDHLQAVRDLQRQQGWISVSSIQGNLRLGQDEAARLLERLAGTAPRAMSDAERTARIGALNKEMDRVYGSKEFKAGARSPEVEARVAELKKERDGLMRRSSGAVDVPAGPMRGAELRGEIKRLEAFLATNPEKMVVTRAELEKLRELAALGHLPFRAGQENALDYAARVGRLMTDPVLKPEWELTATERQARYRNGPMPGPAPASIHEMTPEQRAELPLARGPFYEGGSSVTPELMREFQDRRIANDEGKARAALDERMSGMPAEAAPAPLSDAGRGVPPEPPRSGVGAAPHDPGASEPRSGHYERDPGIAAPHYQDVPGSGRYPAPQPEGWHTILPDRFIPKNEPVADGTLALRWLQEHLPGLYENALRQAAYNATDFTNRVFINYGLNLKFMDSVAKFMFAFPTYATRTPLQFAERLAHRPGQLLAYNKASQDVLQDNQKNHPYARESQRLKYRIGDRLVDYRDLLPFAKLLDPFLYPTNVPEDPFTRTDPMSRFVQAATGTVLGRPQPFIEAGLKKEGVLPRDFTPSVTQDQLQQISTRVTGHDFTPQGAAARLSSAMVGGIPVNQDAYESYIRDQLASMELQQGKAIGHNQFNGAAESKSGPLWDQAKRQADAWLQANRDFRGGQPVRSGVSLPNEEAIGRARADRNAALDRLSAVNASPDSRGPNDQRVARNAVNAVYRENPILETLRPATGNRTIEESVSKPGEFVAAPGSATAGYDWQREQDFAKRQENNVNRGNLGALYNERSNIQDHYGVGSPQDIEKTKQIVDRLRDRTANFPGNSALGVPLSEHQMQVRSASAMEDPKRAAATEMQYGLGPYFDPKTALAAQTVLRFEDANKEVRSALKSAGYNDAIAAGAYDYARQIAEKVPGGHEYLIDLGALKRGLGADQLQLAQDDYVQHHPELGQERAAPSFDQQFRSGATGTADQPTRDLLTEHKDRVAELFAEHPEYRSVLDGLSNLPEHETEEHYIGQHREVFDALNAITNEINHRGLGLAEFRLEQAKAGQGLLNPNTPGYQRSQFQYEGADAPTRQALSDKANLRNELWAAHPEYRGQYHDYLGLETPAEKRDYQRTHADLFLALDGIDARITKDDAIDPRLAGFRESSALAAKGFGDPKQASFLAREHTYFDEFTQPERQAFDAYNAFVQSDTGRRYLDLVTTLIDKYGGPTTPAGSAWWAEHKGEYNEAKKAYNDGLRAIAVREGADPLTAANRVKAAEGLPLLSSGSVGELKDPSGKVGGKGHGGKTLEEAMAAGLERYKERTQWQRDALSQFGEVTQRGALDPLDKLADFNKHTAELDFMRFYGSLTPWEKATLKEQGLRPAKGSPSGQFTAALMQGRALIASGTQRNRLDKGQLGNRAGLPGGFWGPGFSNQTGKQFELTRGTGIRPASGRSGGNHRGK